MSQMVDADGNSPLARFAGAARKLNEFKKALGSVLLFDCRMT
ncbi:MAG TPA: hypothetical protein VMU22_02745 [Rhizomicrobium sp.]|nr:hypothetical protein [Rhizomicrobium sp.]